MKTEAEIRKHRDNLLALLQRAGCKVDPGRMCGHCLARSSLMAGLSWVLGENEDHERAVEDIDAQAKRG